MKTHYRNTRTLLETVYEKSYQKMLFYTQSILNDDFLAEDIIQDTFVHIYLQDNLFLSEKVLRDYMYRCLRNQCIDLLRRKQIWRTYEETYSEEHYSKPVYIEQENSYDELLSLVELRIDNLPPKCRLIFSMKFREGQTNPEISKKLNLSIKTVENQLYIARTALKSYLGSYLCS
ncbi:MAG: sigma-70 family RNA polymerase sigma factor [Tannerella sp.]|nr:sigma-70 family RNA polymerase sigma factor [Tannerella sp.]